MNAYNSKTHLFTKNQIDETTIDTTTRGYSFKAEKEYKDIILQYFQDYSETKGSGISKEINNNVPDLSSNSPLKIGSQSSNNSIQIGYKIQDSRVFYKTTKFSKNLYLNIQDKDDKFYIPVNLKGRSNKYTITQQINDKLNFSLSYLRGKSSSLDQCLYNDRPVLGVIFSESEYSLLSMDFFKKNKSDTIYFGIDEYSGDISGAGTIEVIKNFWQLIFGGYYLYKYNAEMEFKRVKFNFEKGNFNLNYSYAPTKITLLFDGIQRTIIGSRNPYNGELKLDKVHIHTLSFNIKRKLFKNTFIIYTFSQVVPIVSKKEQKENITYPTYPEKKTSGGNVNCLSVEYLF